MIVKKKTKYTLISLDESSFSEFYSLFLSKKDDFKKDHIVLQIADSIQISTKDCLQFLDLSDEKRENGTSFVIINSQINIDDFPENFNIVPTLQEAEDVLEMEAIERELGF